MVASAPGQPDDLIRLETARGVIPVRLTRKEEGVVFGWMTQPLPSVAPYPKAGEVLQALGVRASGLPVEIYVRDHSDAQFSHGLCAECMPRMRQQYRLSE